MRSVPKEMAWHFLSCPLVMVRSVDAVGNFLLSLLRGPGGGEAAGLTGGDAARANANIANAIDESHNETLPGTNIVSPTLTVVEVPCRYATLLIPDPPGSTVRAGASSLVMVQSDSCDEELRASLATYAVRQLFLCVDDPREIQKR
jgi:hypothetical protein